MKKLILAVLVAMTLCAAATAQEFNNEDGTGRGRYMWTGAEYSYPGAQVVTSLPAGASCGPVGELKGVPVHNSTGTNTAILSKLTDKAKIAVSGGRIFLCECALGFNELFLFSRQAQPVVPQTTPVGSQQQQQQTLSPQITVNPPQVTVNPPQVTVQPAQVTVNPQITVQSAPAQVTVISKCDGWCKANTIFNGVQAGADVFQAIGTYKIANNIKNFKFPTGGRPPGAETGDNRTPGAFTGTNRPPGTGGAMAF